MSTNVPLLRDKENEKLIPLVLDLLPVQPNDPDWDDEAGLTGALEGNEDNLKRLKPIQYQAISLKLQGKTNASIASLLGVTRKSVGRWFAVGSLIREIYETRNHDLWEASMQYVGNLHMKALGVINSALESPDERTRLRAASLTFKQLSYKEPFDPESMTKSEKEYREEKRMFGHHAHYAYFPWQDPTKGEINRLISWKRSEHNKFCDAEDYGHTTVNSFVLRPDEINDFYSRLNSRGLDCVKIQDVIYVSNSSGKALASIFSIRAEQPSVFIWDRIDQTGRETICEFLDIPSERERKLDCYNRNCVIIPRNTPKSTLIQLLTQIVFGGKRELGAQNDFVDK